MSKLKFTFFSILLICFNVVADEPIKFQIEALANSPIDFFIGDSVKVKIIVFPNNLIVEKDVYNLNKSIIYDSFFLSNIQNVEKSQNNHEAFEAIGILSFINKYEPEKIKLIDIGKQKAFVSFNRFNFKDNKIEVPQEFILISSEYKLPWDRKLVFLMSVFLICLIIVSFIFINRRFKESRERKAKAKEKEEKMKFWNQQFQKPMERIQLEYIYTNRNIWLELIGKKTMAINDFFRVLEEHQYKKLWTDEELEEIKTSFDPIKRIFKNGI